MSKIFPAVTNQTSKCEWDFFFFFFKAVALISSIFTCEGCFSACQCFQGLYSHFERKKKFPFRPHPFRGWIQIWIVKALKRHRRRYRCAIALHPLVLLQASKWKLCEVLQSQSSCRYHIPHPEECRISLLSTLSVFIDPLLLLSNLSLYILFICSMAAESTINTRAMHKCY